ncbi:MAG: hypothetical protein ACK4K0_08295 [Flavobacteriales bacterium]
MVQLVYQGELNFSLTEFIVCAGWLVIIYFFAIWYRGKRGEGNPAYHVFYLGLTAKIVGAICFALGYTVVYKGGDTIAYYETSMSYSKLALYNPGNFFKAYFISGNSQEAKINLFDVGYTGMPINYIYVDSKTLFTSKFYTPFLILTGNGYFACTILVGALSYIGNWGLYLLFYRKYPEQKWLLAIAILFLPSTLFWTGGLSKDTITFLFTCSAVYFFYRLIEIKYSTVYLALFFFCLWILVAVKPYVILVMLPAMAIWFLHRFTSKIEKRFIRIIALPLFLIISIAVLLFIFNMFGESMGKFSVDNALETAVMTQYDLKQDYYGGNSFDIGDFEPTAMGVLSKFPVATFAGLFRPTILEVRTPLSLISAIENIFLLWLCGVLFLRLLLGFFYKGTPMMDMLKSEPVLIYCLIFTLIFSFMIGLTTSNFGALVRFKTPMLPFYATAVFVLVSRGKKLF